MINTALDLNNKGVPPSIVSLGKHFTNNSKMCITHPYQHCLITYLFHTFTVHTLSLWIFPYIRVHNISSFMEEIMEHGF